MKRIGLLFLVAVMALGLAGCPGTKDEDPVGSWTLHGDEGCDGSTEYLLKMHIYNNGTFIDDGGDTGNWSVDKKDITLNFSGVAIVFTGEVDDDHMDGTFTGYGVPGCWTAIRTSTSP